MSTLKIGKLEIESYAVIGIQPHPGSRTTAVIYTGAGHEINVEIEDAWEITQFKTDWAKAREEDEQGAYDE